MAEAYLDAANTCYSECQRRDKEFAYGNREIEATFQVIPSVFLYFRAIELTLKGGHSYSLGRAPSTLVADGRRGAPGSQVMAQFTDEMLHRPGPQLIRPEKSRNSRSSANKCRCLCRYIGV